jgi:hypothetical protein
MNFFSKILVFIVFSCSRMSNIEISNYYLKNKNSFIFVLNYDVNYSLNISILKKGTHSYELGANTAFTHIFKFSNEKELKVIISQNYNKADLEIYNTLFKLLENGKFDRIDYVNKRTNSKALIELLANFDQHLIITRDKMQSYNHKSRFNYTVIDSLSFNFDYFDAL